MGRLRNAERRIIEIESGVADVGCLRQAGATEVGELPTGAGVHLVRKEECLARGVGNQDAKQEKVEKAKANAACGMVKQEGEVHSVPMTKWR